MFASQMTAADVLDQLLQLNDWIKPGLTEDEFLELFIHCRYCGLIMTGHVFQRHTFICQHIPTASNGNRASMATVAVIHNIIDLTSDEGDHPEVIDVTRDDDDDCPGVIDLTLDV